MVLSRWVVWTAWLCLACRLLLRTLLPVLALLWIFMRPRLRLLFKRIWICFLVGAVIMLIGDSSSGVCVLIFSFQLAKKKISSAAAMKC